MDGSGLTENWEKDNTRMGNYLLEKLPGRHPGIPKTYVDIQMECIAHQKSYTDQIVIEHL